MAADYATTGLSPHFHPMELLREQLHEGIISKEILETMPDGAQVTIAGLVVCRQRPGTAKGIVFASLEDETGIMNVIIWPDLYEQERVLVKTEPFLVVDGELQKRDGTTNVVARSLESLRVADFVSPKAHNFG
jgi:error-prone DNA polymerase